MNVVIYLFCPKLFQKNPFKIHSSYLSLYCFVTPHSCTAITYFTWTGFAGSIAVFTYVLGIPAFAYLVLRKNQHYLHEPKKRAMFGFLTNGYNLQRAWHWEVVVMLRKTSVVAVSVLFRPMVNECCFVLMCNALCGTALFIMYSPGFIILFVAGPTNAMCGDIASDHHLYWDACEQKAL